MERDGGVIVNIGSISASVADPSMALYNASKAFVHALTRSIAVDHGPRVRCNTVCPGWIRTEMADAEMSEFGAPLDLGREEAYEEVTRLVPQRRPGIPQEAAAAVLWLLGPEASYVNGAVLSVDGGTALPDPGTVPFAFEVRAR
jgi:NAD(P)-dependent dehydrogenase (short-subunit alcohol dehydrogenase family)